MEDANVEQNTDSCDQQPDRRGEDRRSEERREVVDARLGMDRRDMTRQVESTDRRAELDRRRGPGRRRSDTRRSAEEGEMSEEQFAFLMAINEYKSLNKRPFPTWTEVLDVIRAMGYRKVAGPENIQ
ncbi:MAG: hypothetical protein HN350_03710 [Phycisphaerales bacterium]|jgi:hypothetical protein|nr:hypothetical protein [Phycisphaerales bacterium]